MRGTSQKLILSEQIRCLPAKAGEEDGNLPALKIHLHLLRKEHRQAQGRRNLGVQGLQEGRCRRCLDCFVSSTRGVGGIFLILQIQWCAVHLGVQETKTNWTIFLHTAHRPLPPPDPPSAVYEKLLRFKSRRVRVSGWVFFLCSFFSFQLVR